MDALFCEFFKALISFSKLCTKRKFGMNIYVFAGYPLYHRQTPFFFEKKTMSRQLTWVVGN